MDARLRFTRDELMSSHAYAAPHQEAGYRLHGGFLSNGAYVSPRTLVRWPAVRAWEAALEGRGWPLIDATRELIKGEGYPNFAQHKLLLQNGFGRALWNALTVTGVIEARGQALCQVTAPDLQPLIVQGLGETASGHLNAGLLYAHGADEGGDPARPGEGAHDAMWFAARDLVLGKNAFPMSEVPASISREVEEREMPQIPEAVEQLVKFLMNVLMIEVRAEVFFSLCVALFRDPELFTDRRADAELAATLVERIRADEAIHVSYLRVLISELRSFDWRGKDGRMVPGAELIDPVWARMVEWHGVTERRIAAQRGRETLERQLVAATGESEGRALLARIDALDRPADA